MLFVTVRVNSLSPAQVVQLQLNLRRAGLKFTMTAEQKGHGDPKSLGARPHLHLMINNTSDSKVVNHLVKQVFRVSDFYAETITEPSVANDITQRFMINMNKKGRSIQEKQATRVWRSMYGYKNVYT